MRVPVPICLYLDEHSCVDFFFGRLVYLSLSNTSPIPTASPPSDLSSQLGHLFHLKKNIYNCNFSVVIDNFVFLVYNPIIKQVQIREHHLMCMCTCIQS